MPYNLQNNNRMLSCSKYRKKGALLVAKGTKSGHDPKTKHKDKDLHWKETMQGMSLLSDHGLKKDK
jgi:hypothetical protein